MSDLKKKVLNALTVAMVVAAIGVGVTGYRRPQIQPIANQGPPRVDHPVREWAQLVATGRRIGPPNAKLTIVEFGDFECPFCGQFAAEMDTLMTRHTGDVALIYHHFPLSYHHLAYSMARAAECAADQDRFPSFFKTAFAKQDSIGIFTPADYGLAAGVPDTARFRKCAGDKHPVQRVEADMQTGRAIGVYGTPGVIVNGVYRAAPPTLKELEDLATGHRS